MTGNKPNCRNDNSIEIRCFGARHEIIAHKLSPVEWERKKYERETTDDSNRCFLAFNSNLLVHTDIDIAEYMAF